MSFTQRVAIVTGAAQGIGRAVAIRLAQDGLDVVVSDVESKTRILEEVAVEIRRLGTKSIVIAADVSIEEQVEYLVSQTVKELGGLDVMVANAGIVAFGPFLETTVQEFEKLYKVNVLGTMLCYRIAGKAMVEQGRGGRLIGASSLAGKKSSPNYSMYSATKFAIRGLTQAAASELGPFGITANAYAPGLINTPMLSAMATRGAEAFKIDEKEYLGAALQQTPLRRVGETVDIAGVVSFLASKDSSYLTGQTLSIDGGLHFD